MQSRGILWRGNVSVDLRATNFSASSPLKITKEEANTAPVVYVRAFELAATVKIRAILAAYTVIVASDPDGLNSGRISAKYDHFSSASVDTWLEYRGSTESSAVSRHEEDVNIAIKHLKKYLSGTLTETDHMNLWSFVSFVCCQGVCSRHKAGVYLWPEMEELISGIGQQMMPNNDIVPALEFIEPTFGAIASGTATTPMQRQWIEHISTRVRPLASLGNMIVRGNNGEYIDYWIQPFQAPLAAPPIRQVVVELPDRDLTTRTDGSERRREVLEHVTNKVVRRLWAAILRKCLSRMVLAATTTQSSS